MLRGERGSEQERKRILELNAGHALVKRLAELSEKPADVSRFGDYCQLVLDQALIAEGSLPKDPARFTRLVTELMVQGD